MQLKRLTDESRDGPHDFQLMDRPNVMEGVGLPCAFRDYEALRDCAWSMVTAGMPKKREFVRYAA
jgi:hypothetical protein